MQHKTTLLLCLSLSLSLYIYIYIWLYTYIYKRRRLSSSVGVCHWTSVGQFQRKLRWKREHTLENATENPLENATDIHDDFWGVAFWWSNYAYQMLLPQGGGEGTAVRIRTSKPGRFHDGSQNSRSWTGLAPMAVHICTSEPPRRFEPFHRLVARWACANMPATVYYYVIISLYYDTIILLYYYTIILLYCYTAIRLY